MIYYKNIGYNINVLQQTACLVVNQITVGNFAFLFNCRRWVGVQTLWRFQLKVSKVAKIRNRYNQVPHLTQDTNGKVTNSQLDTTNESQDVSPLPAGDHKAHINRRANTGRKNTQKIHKRRTALERSVKYFTGGLKQV